MLAVFDVRLQKHEKEVAAALVESVFDALPDLEILLYQFASKVGHSYIGIEDYM